MDENYIVKLYKVDWFAISDWNLIDNDLEIILIVLANIQINIDNLFKFDIDCQYFNHRKNRADNKLVDVLVD
jgi:hypothetical protein